MQASIASKCIEMVSIKKIKTRSKKDD